MDNVLLSIKTDRRTKEDLKAFASELGLTSTALVNVLIKQAIRDRKVTLDLGSEPTPYLAELTNQVEADCTMGHVTHTSSKAAALAHLDDLSCNG